MTQNKLLPCPFCGDEAQPATVQAGGTEWAQVECVNRECGAVGPTPATQEQAAALWNARAATQPMNELLVERVALPREFVDFLLGEAELDGGWFGEPHPVYQGSYWWRAHLRTALSTLPEAGLREALVKVRAISSKPTYPGNNLLDITRIVDAALSSTILSGGGQ